MFILGHIGRDVKIRKHETGHVFDELHLLNMLLVMCSGCD
jgi:hypothetical protein